MLANALGMPSSLNDEWKKQFERKEKKMFEILYFYSEIKLSVV